MSIDHQRPHRQVATYNVAGQTDVQLNFDFDPTQFTADGTTLVIEYEGSQIRLENFFNEDGTSGVENFLTQDGQAFAAADLLAAVMGTENGTGEDIETAADGAAGGAGAGEYNDDPATCTTAWTPWADRAMPMPTRPPSIPRKWRRFRRW